MKRTPGCASGEHDEVLLWQELVLRDGAQASQSGIPNDLIARDLFVEVDDRDPPSGRSARATRRR